MKVTSLIITAALSAILIQPAFAADPVFTPGAAGGPGAPPPPPGAFRRAPAPIPGTTFAPPPGSRGGGTDGFGTDTTATSKFGPEIRALLAAGNTIEQATQILIVKYPKQAGVVLKEVIQAKPESSASIVAIAVKSAPTDAAAESITVIAINAAPEQAAKIANAAITARPSAAAKVSKKAAETVIAVKKKNPAIKITISEVTNAAIQANPAAAVAITKAVVLVTPAAQKTEVTKAAIAALAVAKSKDKTLTVAATDVGQAAVESGASATDVFVATAAGGQQTLTETVTDTQPEAVVVYVPPVTTTQSEKLPSLVLNDEGEVVASDG